MRLLRICAAILPIAWGASSSIRAQSPTARMETVAGVHTVAFETSRGTIRVHVSSDAAPGDAISGIILAEPLGATPLDRMANQDALNSYVLEWQRQRTPVSTGRYEWSIPMTLRAGAGTLLLRDRDEQLIAQASVTVDPVPAATSASVADALELPADVESGNTAVIRERSDGRLSGRTVTLGGVEAELLASSPRQLAFRVPATTPGPVPFRLASNAAPVERTVRVLDVRLSASRTQLLRGQRATLTVTVSGLNGITEAVTLTVVNQSPASVQVENVERPITITPQQVRRGGTFEVTRRITGVRPGPFQIAASVGKPPSAQFDVLRSTTRILGEWQARTGVGIAASASALIQRSVLETRFDDFLNVQKAHLGDVQEVFAALLSHYCFDLRDDGLSRRRTANQPRALPLISQQSPGWWPASVPPRFPGPPRIMLAALRQDRPQGVMITDREVRRLSFSDFVSRLTERFRARQAVGYLFVRSVPSAAPVTINGQRTSEVTDRRFVTPVGDHQIVIAGSPTCRQRVTVSAFETRVVECGV